MGKRTKWTILEEQRRMAARGSERADGSGAQAPLLLHLAPGSGARLEAWLNQPPPPVPDPVDALGEPLQLTPREAWLRGILDAWG